MRRPGWTRLDIRVPRELLAGVAALITLLYLAGLRAPSSATTPSESYAAPPIGLSAEGEEAEGELTPLFGAPESAEVSRGAAVRMHTDVAIHVYDTAKKKVVEMELESYILGVVAAEVPAAYNAEAIKAQAVAARTYALKNIRALGGSGCGKDKRADICTSPAHCQAYASEEDLRKKWGGDYELYWGKIVSAVAATRDEVIVYDGKPIQAFFHAVSGGRTEDALAVFNMNLPYLKSVESLGEEGAPRYRSSTTFTRKQLADKLNKAYPKAKLSAARLEGQIEVLSRFQSGQVEKVRIGSTSVSGSAFRQATGIPSANFSIGYDDKSAVIYTKGYGHGVGMSQAGANAMAAAGTGYKEILAHYYADTQIELIGDLVR